MSWLISKALMADYENSPCLQVPVAEYLAASCSDGKPFAPLSGESTPQAYWVPDKMTAFSRLSRFGMTFKPLMASHGTDLLMWYLAASHARTSALPGKVQESQASEAECGSTWLESLTKFDRNTSSWKTAQCSLLADSDAYLETWPKWGLMLGGECCELPTLARPISESESGYWPTPTAVTATGGAALCKWGGSGARKKLRTMVTAKELNGPLNPQWVSWLMGWPLGWSSLLPLETAKYQQWQQQHGECLEGQ